MIKTSQSSHEKSFSYCEKNYGCMFKRPCAFAHRILSILDTAPPVCVCLLGWPPDYCGKPSSTNFNRCSAKSSIKWQFRSRWEMLPRGPWPVPRLQANCSFWMILIVQARILLVFNHRWNFFDKYSLKVGYAATVAWLVPWGRTRRSYRNTKLNVFLKLNIILLLSGRNKQIKIRF